RSCWGSSECGRWPARSVGDRGPDPSARKACSRSRKFVSGCRIRARLRGTRGGRGGQGTRGGRGRRAGGGRGGGGRRGRPRESVGQSSAAASRFSSIVRSKTNAYSRPAPTAVYGQMK